MSIIGQPLETGTFSAQDPNSGSSSGLGGILGKIFGGAGGQDSLLNSLLTSGLAFGSGYLKNTDTAITDNSTTTPNLDPATLGLRNNLIRGSQNLLGQDPNLKGYTAQGLGNINAESSAQNKVLGQTLAARGLSYSPLASAEQANLGNQQFKQSTDFLNQIPLLKNQLLQQKLANVTNTFRSLPYGQNYSGRKVISGHPLGNALGSLLANLLNKKPGSPGGGGGGVGSGGGSPLQQILQAQFPQLWGLPPYPGSDYPFPPQDPTQVDASQINAGINYGNQVDFGQATDPWSGMLNGIPQNLPGAPLYDPSLTDPTWSGINFSDGGGGGGGFGGGVGDFGGSPEEIF